MGTEKRMKRRQHRMQLFTTRWSYKKVVQLKAFFNQKQQGRNFPKRVGKLWGPKSPQKKVQLGFFLKYHDQVGSKQIIGDLAIQRVASQAGFPFLLLILVPWKQLYEVTLIGESNLLCKMDRKPEDSGLWDGIIYVTIWYNMYIWVYEVSNCRR